MALTCDIEEVPQKLAQGVSAAQDRRALRVWGTSAYKVSPTLEVKRNVIDPGDGSLYAGGSSYVPGMPLLPSSAGLTGLAAAPAKTKIDPRVFANRAAAQAFEKLGGDAVLFKLQAARRANLLTGDQRKVPGFDAQIALVQAFRERVVNSKRRLSADEVRSMYKAAAIPLQGLEGCGCGPFGPRAMFGETDCAFVPLTDEVVLKSDPFRGLESYESNSLGYITLDADYWYKTGKLGTPLQKTMKVLGRSARVATKAAKAPTKAGLGTLAQTQAQARQLAANAVSFSADNVVREAAALRGFGETEQERIIRESKEIIGGSREAYSEGGTNTGLLWAGAAFGLFVLWWVRKDLKKGA